MSRGEEIIESILKKHGYVLDEERPRAVNGNGRDSDSPFRDLNELALKNLEAWVPDLGIYKCVRQRGRFTSYVGVAQWRPSATHGTDLDKRDRNLKICSSGIRDFGDNRGYTPIDLVMAAKACGLHEAVNWLDEKLGWSSGGPEIDIEAIKAKQAEKETASTPEPTPAALIAETPTGPDGRERIRPGKLLGDAWYFGDPVPEQAPMLVPFFIPARGFGYLGGQWGTFKTFIVNDLAVAVASGGKFAGQQVTRRGVVIQIELEGSNNEARMLAAATVRQCENERLPIVHLKMEPPKILTNAQPNLAFRDWAKQLAQFGLAVAAQFDLPLALITVDPQAKVAGFRDEQSSSEGQIVTDAFFHLEKLAGCPVLVVDHLGKDPSAGLRGTSTKETNPLFILNTSEQQKDTFAKRYLEVRKMRNGMTNVAIDFWMEDAMVSTQQIVKDENGVITVEQVTVKTLAIRWGDKLRATTSIKEAGKGTEKSASISEQALSILHNMIAQGGIVLPDKCAAPTGLRGVLLEAWRVELIEHGVIGGKRPGTAFGNVREVLRERSQIETGDGFVWVPLAFSGA